MTAYKRADRTIGSELIEIICIFTLALLVCWAVAYSPKGTELLQENNTEGVGRSLESF